MADGAARLSRLRRIERVREIAKEMKLAEAAQAETTLQQLTLLAARTRAMADGYSQRVDPGDAHQLTSMLSFSRSLHQMSSKVSSDAATAQQVADRIGRDVHAAERRRAAVQDQADALEASIERAALGRYQDPPRRRGFGTNLE